FYHYFSSKEEIFREVAAAHERELGAAVAAEVTSVGAPGAAGVVARLEAANRRYLVSYRDEAKLMRVIEQVTRYDEVLNGERLDRHEVFAERLAEAIGQLQRQGCADPQVDPSVGSQALMAMLTRFAEVWFVEGRVHCSFEEGVVQLNRMWLNALRMGEGTEDHRR
ncbi:MAG TPA: hypothetical protein VMR97_12965, partial [Acidimicrobiales bacterium]|nr:hypothetical protein [Acidimicrobiales bacterium]